MIIEFFYRFMDDGVTLLPDEVDSKVFLQLLNSMHWSIQYTIEESEIVRDKDGGFDLIQKLVFLALILHLNDVGDLWTNVYYKDTNTHEYLNFDSSHPDHVKKNIPYVLAKRIVVFTSREGEMWRNLSDMKKWLKLCNYPENVIDNGIHNALLQGPANKKVATKVIPLISKYVKNYDNKLVVQMTNELLKNATDERMQKAFKDVKLINAYQQPPNLLRTLSSSKFINGDVTIKPGVYRCQDKRCKICNLYLQIGDSVLMLDSSTWEVRASANCNSLNVIYFFVCNHCGEESNIGKTDNFRERTNNHITGCRWGRSTDKFDNHVFKCAQEKGMAFIEPFFKAYILMVCSNYHKLLAHESSLHAKGLDTINR